MKQTGAYQSVLKGVSQQEPMDRLDGQHGEQVNMISDPVRGLTRRNGMQLVLQDHATYTTESLGTAIRDSYSFRTFTFSFDDRSEFDLLYRSRERVTPVTDAHLPSLLLFQRGDDRARIPVVASAGLSEYESGGISAVAVLGNYLLIAGNTVQPTYTTTDVYSLPGNLGRGAVRITSGAYTRTYTIEARRKSNGTTYTATYTTMDAAYGVPLDTSNVKAYREDFTNPAHTGNTSGPLTSSWGPANNGMLVTFANTSNVGSGLWSERNVFAGQRVRVYRDDPAAGVNPIWGDYVEGVVDHVVSGVIAGHEVLYIMQESATATWSTAPGDDHAVVYALVAAEDYQKQLNDVIYAHESATAAHIAAAALDIVPSNIIAGLTASFATAGWSGWTAQGSMMFNDDVDWISVSDSFGGDSIEAVHNVVQDTSDLSPVHYVGKVVMVQPLANSDERYYMKAEASSTSGAPIQEVLWRETAGVVQSPTAFVSLATLVNGTLYWAETPVALDALVFANEAVLLGAPELVASRVGDLDSTPAPNFFTEPITMLALFQDRLLVGSGSKTSFSRVGDYFNFYRKTVLSVVADDTLEAYATGTDGDVIRKAVLYDKNLMILGDQFHYAVNGRVPLDAQSPGNSMTVHYAMRGTSRAQPVGQGQYVFVLKEDQNLAATHVMQVQAGVWQDSPATTPITAQLRDYINGTPAELVALSNPSTLVVRTEFFPRSAGAFPYPRPWGFYVYNFLDNEQGQRLQEAWSAWEWSSSLGTPIGLSSNEIGDGLYLYTMTFGTNQAGQPVRSLLVQSASARSDPTGLPYLDGLMRETEYDTDGPFHPGATGQVASSIWTANDAIQSYAANPNSLDASRWDDAASPYYTVGDSPPEEVDPQRWHGVQGWVSDYAAAYPADVTGGLWSGFYFPSFVDLTNPVPRHQNAKARDLSRIVLQKLQFTTTRTAGISVRWTDRDTTKQPLLYSGTYKQIQQHSAWIGRDIRHVNVRVSAVSFMPLTISTIHWTINISR